MTIPEVSPRQVTVTRRFPPCQHFTMPVLTTQRGFHPRRLEEFSQKTRERIAAGVRRFFGAGADRHPRLRD